MREGKKTEKKIKKIKEIKERGGGAGVDPTHIRGRISQRPDDFLVEHIPPPLVHDAAVAAVGTESRSKQTGCKEHALIE